MSKRTPTKPARPSDRPAPPPRVAGEWTRDAWIFAVAALLCAAVYANSVPGEFIYDDSHQIVDNPFIKENRFFKQAMTSDVWAYKGAKREAWSNYWRPAFVLWLIVNYKLFGLNSAAPWHVTNILLHIGVTMLAYALLRRLHVERLVAAAITFIFAVHPVHVESVGWISGCTDMLLAIPLLGALWFVLSAWERPSAAKWVGALLLYVWAVLSKEASILFPLLVFVAMYVMARTRGSNDATGKSRSDARESPGLIPPALDNDSRTRNPRGQAFVQAALRALPFAIIAGIFLVTRHAVLGQTQIQTPWAPGPIGMALTAPSLLMFYIRQAIFPWYSIGPSYPLRALTPQTLGVENFALPILVVMVTVGLLIWLSRRAPVRQIGLCLFLLPLVPAMNIDAFKQEELVHDRYLYLPILGFLMVVIPAAIGAVTRFLKDRQRAERICFGACCVLCLPLGAVTVWYNTAWTSELNLWNWAVKSDPGSFNLSQYGIALASAHRIEEAKFYLDQSIALRPVTASLQKRASIAATEGRYADAERDYKLILSQFPQLDTVYGPLAVCYQDWGKPEMAESTLRTAREKCPYVYCTFTDNLAVVLYNMGRKDEALRELETARPRVAAEYSPTATQVLFHLGSLYEELHRLDAARAALREFMDVTQRYNDKITLATRANAAQLLAKLGG